MKGKATGILIVGETGSGKSTFGQALAEFYQQQGNIVKTLESPRDLQVVDDITQYNKNFASSEEIHDILLLSRPDYILFDEVRDTPDFKLYIDLKLGASNVIGVVHAATPIDAIQRFISRTEVGMIPSVVDTILFIKEGQLCDVYTLELIVKTPSGMTESDLARPVIEIKDFKKGTLLYEIYSYGEETVVIPVQENKGMSKGAFRLAEKEVERHFRKYTQGNIKAEMANQHRVNVYVPEREISRIIGAGGKTIEHIEEELGISIEIREFKEERYGIDFTLEEDKKSVLIYAEPGRNIEVLIDKRFLFSAITSKKGLVNVHKKSNIGRELLKAMNKKQTIEVKG